MKRTVGQILLPEKAVRWTGIGLLVAGLMLPIAVLVGRAASWNPSALEEIGEAPLRPEMVVLPPGKFLMGSPEDEEGRDDDETLHEVTLTRSFAVSRTEITQGQYAAVIGKRPLVENNCESAGEGEDFPVVCVNWFEAVTFCNELSRREGLTPAYAIQGEDVAWDQDADGYRLLTEAEWEYTARAGTRDLWVGTSDVEAVCRHDNVVGSDSEERLLGLLGENGLKPFPCDDGFAALAPVASKQLHRWQIYDLGGNALEWVWDTYDDYPDSSEEDPVADVSSAPSRVVRGGSWGDFPQNARVADRYRIRPSLRYDFLGFRVARSYPLPSSP